MTLVKTYASVHKDDDQLNFSISKMEDIYLRSQGRIDAPHRHNFYTVLVVIQSKGIHKIDFNSYELGENQVFFVSPGQVHQVIEYEMSKGYVLTFSSDFLIKNSIPLAFISDLNLFQNYGQSPPLAPSKEDFEKMVKYSEKILSLYMGEEKHKLLSIGAYLKLMLIQSSNACTLQEAPNESSRSHLIRNFKNAVDHDFKNEHSTSYYADLLHITPDHLNRTVKDKLGKTAKEYIQARITIEAKRLLYFTDLANKEIGYELGFNEPANFSAFFKKCTQLSPSEFRKKETKS